jgi:D-lactate dehydrogenase (cytochrome)
MPESGPSSAPPVDRVYSALASRCRKDQVLNSEAARREHAHGESYHPDALPDAVFYAESTDEVASAVTLCHAHGVPVVAFGAGTSLEGHVAATNGGLCIDLSRMNRVVRVSAEDLDCTVECGVTRRQLNDHLGRMGMFFPVDPGADASIGGMVATGASGTNAVGYGTMRHNVLGLTVVLAGGQIITTGGRARKSSAGYDLTRLFVGSEGTLGIATQVTLRLFGIPPAIASSVCAFASIKDAVDAAIETIQQAVPVARVELLDERQIEASCRYSGITMESAPTLFFEFHGSEPAVDEYARAVADITAGHGGRNYRHAIGRDQRAKLWRARHDAYYAARALRPGAKALTTDVCVPISELASCVTAAKERLADVALEHTIVGHVGDGNFHVIILFDPDDSREAQLAEDVNASIVMQALSAGGTCTGEHGVGYGKVGFLEIERAPAEIELMRSLKRALDPSGILNPGKILRP